MTYHLSVRSPNGSIVHQVFATAVARAAVLVTLKGKPVDLRTEDQP